MENKEKNIVDKFLDGYEQANNDKVIYKRVYQRPSKIKAIVGFVFSLIIFIILIRYFVFKLLYFVILLGDLSFLSYYGLNLFTEKGFGLPKTIPVIESAEDIDNKKNEDIYRV